MVSRPRQVKLPDVLQLRITPELRKAVDAGAAARKMTRSDFARECLERGLNSAPEPGD